MTLDRGYPRSSVMSASSDCRLNPNLNTWCIEALSSVYSTRPWHQLMPGLCSIDAKPESLIPALPHIVLAPKAGQSQKRRPFLKHACLGQSRVQPHRTTCTYVPSQMLDVVVTMS